MKAFHIKNFSAEGFHVVEAFYGGKAEIKRQCNPAFLESIFQLRVEFAVYMATVSLEMSNIANYQNIKSEYYDLHEWICKAIPNKYFQKITFHDICQKFYDVHQQIKQKATSVAFSKKSAMQFAESVAESALMFMLHWKDENNYPIITNP